MSALSGCRTAPMIALVLVALLCGTTLGQSTVTQVAGAVPDETYNGYGNAYVPIEDLGSTEGGEPKSNHTYTWGLTVAGNRIWLGTGANTACWGAGALGQGGFEIPGFTVCEATDSQFPGVPELLKPIFGDWRPPQVWIHQLDGTANQTLVHVNDSIVNRTMGWRAAGECDGIVLLAGPSLFGVGIQLIAFDSKTLKFLGSKSIRQYSNIRKFLKHDDVLYCGVQNTIGGGGSILRWTGNRRDPFSFQTVGLVDNEVANLGVCQDRLFAATWPPSALSSLTGAVQVALGNVSEAGIWMSPKVPRGGLRLTFGHIFCLDGTGNAWWFVLLLFLP